MTVLLILELFVVIASAHNITFLEVPQYGDPRRDAQLACYYVNEKGDPPLHSVKWYRDNNEIFRFTPGQIPPTRSFNTSGRITRGSCDMQSCVIGVTLPQRYNTRIAYTCEVSTEGPRFAVVKQTKYLFVAVALKEDPVISGLPGTVQFGEEVQLNCSTSPAMPPANIVWYIDGKPEKAEPWAMVHTEVSAPDEYGLRSSWQAISVSVTTPQGVMNLRCEATQPTRPPNVRSTNASLIVAWSPHLGKFTAAGRGIVSTKTGVMLLTTCVTAHIFSKYSALNEV